MRSTVFEFVAIILMLSLLCPLSHQKKAEPCSYTIEVKTACSWHINPGTGNPVSVRFGNNSFGEEGRGEVLERSLSEVAEKGKKPFQRCKTDKFKLSGPCLEGKVCYLYFMVDGKDDWRVAKATVYGRNEPDVFHQEIKLTNKVWKGHDYCKVRPRLASDQVTNDYSQGKRSKKPSLPKSPGNRRRGCRSC